MGDIKEDILKYKNKVKHRNDALWEIYKPICNPKFKRWYLKCFYYIPEIELERLARESLKEIQTAMAFSHKLKAYMKEYTFTGNKNG